MKEGRYIYGVIKADKKESFNVNAGEKVYTIPYQDVSCVVSNSTIQDYSSMLKEDLGRLLVKHQTIIERIMKDHTTIPMKFGTSLSGDDEVTEVLKRGYPQFKELLTNMDGRIELDVACTWGDLNSVIKEIAREDKEIREFKARVAKMSLSEALQDRIKIGMMVKNALDKEREKKEKHIIDFLKSVTIDFQKHQVMDDGMILNYAFLLEKKKEPDFENALKTLDKEYKETLSFKCVGPLPPYSFATCQVKKVDCLRIEEARKLLGLGEKSVSLNEVKDSYRRLAQKNHPDKDLKNTRLGEEFEKITDAYKLLSSCCQSGEFAFANNKQNDFIMVEIIRP